jgi:hypothetical protein
MPVELKLSSETVGHRETALLVLLLVLELVLELVLVLVLDLVAYGTHGKHGRAGDRETRTCPPCLAQRCSRGP